MMKNLKSVTTLLVILAFLLISPLSHALTAKKYNKLLKSGIPKKTLDTAVKAFGWAKQRGEVHKDVLTIVDFSIPSSKKRMWVIDMKSGKILHHTLVAHGRGSGGNTPTRFSNRHNSHQSSLGTYVTRHTYTGKHGASLRISGLEKNVNHNAMKRAIVFHPAKYATPSFVKSRKRLGRSHGCFAVSPKISKAIIKDIKGGSVIYAYAPKMADNPRYASISLDKIIKNYGVDTESELATTQINSYLLSQKSLGVKVIPTDMETKLASEKDQTDINSEETDNYTVKPPESIEDSTDADKESEAKKLPSELL